LWSSIESPYLGDGQVKFSNIALTSIDLFKGRGEFWISLKNTHVVALNVYCASEKNDQCIPKVVFLIVRPEEE
jgi:hypothetical protein